MAILVGKRGLLQRKKGKKYFGYKVYGRPGMKYSRNEKIARKVWS